MSAAILGLGTANPPHKMSQDEATKMFTEIACEEERQARLASVLFRKAEVLSRSMVVPHKIAYNWCEDTAAEKRPLQSVDRTVPSEITPVVKPGQSSGPTTGERMELYARFASDLAVASSQQALARAQVAPESITHLVVVTCTGFAAPGVDLDLIEQLSLPRTTQRIQVGFMGCHGAVNGIRVALAIVDADPTAKVLLCAIELCSLHYRYTWDLEGIIGNALFGDGSAAMVLGGGSSTPAEPQPTEPSAPTWRVNATGSAVIRDSRDTMSWKIGDHGFEMRLTSDVGDKIQEQLSDWMQTWLASQNLTLEQVDYWGVHPGGPRILSAVQNSLGLSDADLATSRSILQRHGNMSSPTVLFILNEFRQQHRLQQASSPKRCVLLGFGPGLVAEIALLTV